MSDAKAKPRSIHDVLYRIIDDSIPVLRIKHAPVKFEFGVGLGWHFEISWQGVKEAIDNIYKNIETKEYDWDGHTIGTSDIWLTVEPAEAENAYRIYLLVTENF